MLLFVIANVFCCLTLTNIMKCKGLSLMCSILRNVTHVGIVTPTNKNTYKFDILKCAPWKSMVFINNDVSRVPLCFVLLYEFDISSCASWCLIKWPTLWSWLPPISEAISSTFLGAHQGIFVEMCKFIIYWWSRVPEFLVHFPKFDIQRPTSRNCYIYKWAPNQIRIAAWITKSK